VPRARALIAGVKAAVSSLLDRSVHWSQEDVASFLETIDSGGTRFVIDLPEAVNAGVA
jgi:hypothetical protein